MLKTIKTYEAIELLSNLSTITNDVNRKLPGNIAWAISRTCRKLRTIENDFKQVQQDKFELMYSEKKAIDHVNESGQTIRTILPEYMKEYADYINEIAVADVDIDIQGIDSVAFEKFLDTYELSVPEIEALDMLVKTNED